MLLYFPQNYGWNERTRTMPDDVKIGNLPNDVTLGNMPDDVTLGNTPSYTNKAQLDKDWSFMEQSENVLSNVPDTWKQYPETIKGKHDIIAMEYNEFSKAISKEEKMHELVHLASACLYLWRELNEQ